MEITTRAATADDYDAVLDIVPGLYLGLDYIPVFYHRLLQDPNSNMFVAIVDEKVVGFVNYYVTDNATAIVTMALRTNPDYRGKGVAKALQNEREMNVLLRYPSVKYYRWAGRDSDYNMKLIDEGKVVEMRKWHMLFINVDHEKLKEQCMKSIMKKEEPSTTQVIRISPTKIHNILANEKNRNHIFPDKLFISAHYICWLPVQVASDITTLVSNITDDTIVFATMQQSGNQSQDECESISYCSYMEVPAGMVYTIYYHGYNADDLICHLRRHFLVILAGADRQEQDNQVFIELSFPSQIDGEYVYQYMLNTGKLHGDHMKVLILEHAVSGTPN